MFLHKRFNLTPNVQWLLEWVNILIQLMQRIEAYRQIVSTKEKPETPLDPEFNRLKEIRESCSRDPVCLPIRCWNF